MGSLAEHLESRKALLADWQAIYDSHRFLDAYQASANYWTKSTAVDELVTEEIIFAARLASRLGGERLSRYLYRKALERDPELPLVRYFTRHLPGTRKLLLDELWEFEKNPELGGENTELQANWLATHAYTFGILRDFTRARDLLKKAHELCPGDAWIFSQEADILGMADLWHDARQTAERGCEADPKSPWPILSLATALLNLGEIEEAARRIAEAAESSQYCRVVQSACWYHCALAETCEGEERRTALEAAKKFADRLEPMSPLADREFKASLARTWLDLAEMNDDHAGMEHWSREARSPFHRKVLANLSANPHGKRIRLPYRRTIQKHVECVPTSISTALSASGGSISVDDLAREVTFGGTAEWAAADWMRSKGFYVRFFSATAEVTAQLIEAGIGFTVSWDDDESGHCVAIVGIDLAAGTVIAHDPTSFRSVEYLLSHFNMQHGPLGVPAMATVPSSRAEVLDRILPPESDVMEAAEARQRAIALFGPAAARPIVDEIEARFPDHPGTHYLRAMQDLQNGSVGRALGGFRKLLATFPQAPAVRVQLMAASRLLGDTVLLRDTLRSVVDTGKVPGVDSQREWATPHPRYFCEYADLLRSSAETWAQAESLLRSVLKNNWRSANAWHILADLRWMQRDTDRALLAYRIASTVAGHNEHYASAYADMLCRSGRTHEGLEWLRNRAEELGTSIHAVSTWITYVNSLEDWGAPDQALKVCRDILERFDASPSLLTFAVPFFGRMGQPQEAERWFEVLKNANADTYFREAAVYFFEMRGRTVEALEHAEAWVSEAPLSMSARNKLLTLTARIHGDYVALDRAALWMQEQPENEEFESIFCQRVRFPIWRKLRVLKSRVKRNQDDAWAWRELVFAVISKFESADEKHQQRLRPEIVSCLAELDRLTVSDATTLRAHGFWHEAQCDWKAAHACYLESIRLDPEHAWGYHRAFEISARLSAEEQRAMWAGIEPIWLATSGHLANCMEMMRHVNRLFGPRKTEQIIANWQKRRPDDPNVTEAMADLLLDFGQGRSDATRALDLLRPAVERYPYHAGLRYSLARAWRATGDDAESGKVFEELALRRPDDVSALIQLAWIREREGRTEEALRILAQAAEQEPQNSEPLDAWARILIENQRLDEALAILEDALRRLPMSISIYQRTIALFLQMDEEQKAVDAARQGIEAYPHGAYLWLLLGKTLRDHPQFAAPGEVERCLRRSLEFNHGLYEAADLLIVDLTRQRRYDDALEVLSDIELRVADPAAIRGRRAWIKYQVGEKREATTDLASVLTRFPGYQWGWNVLLGWLETEKDWNLTQKLLGPVPPQMAAQLTFRKDRLLLLKESGTPAVSLDPEWLQLLDDFPEDVSLHLHRFDTLRDAKRWEEAAATLQRVAPIAGEDIYFTARLADVQCHNGQFQQALESALKVCFAPVELSDWPVSRVWEIFREARREEDLAEEFRAKLNGGAQPTRRALSRFALYLVAGESRVPRVTKLIRQTRLHHVTRKIFSLWKIVQTSSWRDEFHPADLFAILNDRRYPRLVIRFWKEMCQQQLDGDSDAWGQAGRAMVNRHRFRMAHHLFRDWRKRRGVRMWSLANYVQSLSRFRRSQLQEVIATCRDALADLPHDHCARYLVFMQAEACALAGDKEGMLAVWRDRRAYFDDELKKSEYFKAEEKPLLRNIPELVESLQSDDKKGYRTLVWRICLRRLRDQIFHSRVGRIVLRVLAVFIFWAFWHLVGAVLQQ